MKKMLLTLVILCLSTASAFAAPLSIFSGWTEIAAEDQVLDGGFVDPGWGGQNFDAEYLFVKHSGSQLSIGLQTGFDVSTGVVKSGSKYYYSGDLALSFDNDTSIYEYAFDFGLHAYGYASNAIRGTDYGQDGAALYYVEGWSTSTDIAFDKSNPFVMASGNEVGKAIENHADYDQSSDSFYRIVTFDLALASIDLVGLDVHWTMSCGNDEIDGHYDPAPVPEPATLVLLGSGLAGLAFYRRRMKK